MKQLSDIVAWTTISPAPVLAYLESIGEYVVVWQGWAMSLEQAVLIYGEKFLNVFPSPSMVRASSESFSRVTKSGELTHVPGIKAAPRGIRQLTKIIKIDPAITADKTLMLTWFNKKSAYVITGEEISQ